MAGDGCYSESFAWDRHSYKGIIKMQSLFWSLHSLILGFSQLAGDQHKSWLRKDEKSSKRQVPRALVALSCDMAVMWDT